MEVVEEWLQRLEVGGGMKVGEWCGMEFNSMKWNGMLWNGIEWNGSERNVTT